MKKFYAFVCAVAVALTASAGPIDFAPKAKKDITKLEIATKSAKTSLTNAKRVKHASRISADDAGLEADKVYLEESYSFAANAEGNGSRGGQIDGPVKLLRAEDDTYTIEGFYGLEGVNLTGGVYDAVEGTLTFQHQVVATGLSQMGADFESVMVVTVDNDDNFLEDLPIVFKVDIANRNLFYMCDTDDEGNPVNCVGIALLDTDNEVYGFMDYLGIIDLNEVNGMNAFMHIEEGKQYQEQLYVYNEVVEGNLVTTGLFGLGFGYPVTFTLNKETNTAVADNQVVFQMDAGNDNYLDFMFYDLIFNADTTKIEEFGEPVVTFDIISQENEGVPMTYIYKDISFVGTPYNGQMGSLFSSVIYGFQVIYFGDIFDPSGIHDVQLDKNNNGPVEYYNLQGIRVSEPTKGGIYIRRQGNVSTKIMR